MEYKIGDKVRIKSLDWYNQNKDEDGLVRCGDKVFDDYMSVLFISVILNTIMHAWTDDEKANKLNITLFEDQIIHLGQIVGTWAILTIY